MLNLIQKINNLSQKPLSNPKLIQKYLSESFSLNKKIILYDWECPPRFINQKNGKEFVDFNVDYQKIFKKEKIDRFTETPRTITNKKMEIKILKILVKESLKIEFYKFIADTNIDLVQNEYMLANDYSIKKFYEFENLLQQETNNYPIKTSIMLFSDFLKKKKLYRKYKIIYKTWLKKINQDCSFKIILNQQIKRTNQHMGIKNQKFARQIAIKTIASYAAEGAVFELLNSSQEKYIWLNFSENDKRTIKITNLARLEKMPMIFPKLNDN